MQLICNDVKNGYNSCDINVLSVDKKWIKKCNSTPGDLILIISGEKKESRVQIGNLRLKMAEDLGVRNPQDFAPVWITDFPLF